VLLANPRWERRFVRFLELSGVGRTMADGTDEDGARAARMDEWVVWEVGNGIASSGVKLFLSRRSSLSFLYQSCKGVLLPPIPAHSALWRATDLICCNCPAKGRQLYFPFVCVALLHIP